MTSERAAHGWVSYDTEDRWLVETDRVGEASRIVGRDVEQWVADLVFAALAAPRGEPPEPGPAIDVERLARALMAVGIVKWDDKLGMHASYGTVAEAIAAEYAALRDKP